MKSLMIDPPSYFSGYLDSAEESLCILRVSEVSKVCNKDEGFSASRFI